MALVEVTTLLGQVHGFAGVDVLEVNDGVGYAALGADDEPVEADGFASVRGADLGIFGDGEIQLVGRRPGPFDGSGDGSTIGDGDDFIVALRGGEACGHKKRNE